MKPGVKKQSLEERTKVAWFKATDKEPDLIQNYGSDGWRVFQDNVIKKTPEELAVLFKVAFPTVYKWKRMYQDAEK